MSGSGVGIRLGRVFREGNRATIADFSRQALSNRPENVERCKDYLLKNEVDGVLLAPDQLQATHDLLLGRKAPRIFLRLDWSPKIGGLEDAGDQEDSEQWNLTNVPELTMLGADGGVLIFPLGFSEELEYSSFKKIANASHEARRMGMPLLVDAWFGKEITDKNRLEAAELAVMMSTEAGADGVFVPAEEKKEELWERLQNSQIPVFLKVPAPASDAIFPRIVQAPSWDTGS